MNNIKQQKGLYQILYNIWYNIKLNQGKKTMANISDTAKYILQQYGSMSSMKLQKLCYYSQAWSLVWDDAPLFNEDFQAWATGSVCPELFFKLLLKNKSLISVDDITGGEGDLTANQKDTIDKVLEHYGSHTAQWLSQLTQIEEPWQIAREGVPSGVGCDNIITKESMAMYYGGM